MQAGTTTPGKTRPPCLPAPTRSPCCHPSTHGKFRDTNHQHRCKAAKLHSEHTIIHSVTGQSFEHAKVVSGADADKWLYSTENEFGRLTKGIMQHMPSGSETMCYPPHHALLKGRKFTYARFVATERTHKTNTKRFRLAIGGNLIHYPDKVSIPTADLSAVKMLPSGIISTPGARFATFDLKDF
jgi:hypothetical protein